LNAGIDALPLLFHLFRLAQSLEDALLVEFVEEHHLQGLLTLLHQEETDDLGNAVIKHLNHDVEISIQALFDLAHEKSLWIILGGCFLDKKRYTASN
jgi:hypothetical protein